MTPLKISPEAREAADNEYKQRTVLYGLPLAITGQAKEEGHFVQLAINSAVAENDKEIERLRNSNHETECFALRSANESLTKQLTELREIAEGLANMVADEFGSNSSYLHAYTQWKERNQ